MCYVCRQEVSHRHFCSCGQYSAEPGKRRCHNCNRCSLFESEAEDNEALAAKEEALKELVEKEPKLLDMEIGPPLKWWLRRVQEPQREEHHRHHFPPNGVRRQQQHHRHRFPPNVVRRQQENHRHRAFPPNGIARPPQFNEFGNQAANIVVPPLLPAVNPLSPPQEFFRPGNWLYVLLISYL